MRQRRKDLKLTMPELARRSGVSVGAISDLEHGRTKKPLHLTALAASLECSVEWLEHGRGNVVQLPRSHDSPDLELMAKVIEDVEWACQQLRLSPEPKTKSERILGLYRAYKESKQQPVRALVLEFMRAK